MNKKQLINFNKFGGNVTFVIFSILFAVENLELIH